MFSVTACTCAVAMILQCALLLYGVFAGSLNTVAALVILIIVEIIPGVVLVQLPRMHLKSNAPLGVRHATAATALRQPRRHLVLLPVEHYEERRLWRVHSNLFGVFRHLRTSRFVGLQLRLRLDQHSCGPLTLLTMEMYDSISQRCDVTERKMKVIR